MDYQFHTKDNYGMKLFDGVKISSYSCQCASPSSVPLCKDSYKSQSGGCNTDSTHVLQRADVNSCTIFLFINYFTPSSEQPKKCTLAHKSQHPMLVV